MSGAAAYSHLRGWTPISFSSEPAPTLLWADMRKLRFDDPFFIDTVQKWRGDPSRVRETTDLQALAALDTEPSLDPCLIITQASYCGSTLLARLLRAIDGTVVVCEPRIVSKMLSYSLHCAADFPIQRTLRQTARALGRVRFGDERRLVLKLGSALTRYLPLLRRTFPGVPVVWLQRRPAEILESTLRRAPSRRGGKPEEDDEYLKINMRKIFTAFLAASIHAGEGTLVLDYLDLPDSVWIEVAPLIGAIVTEQDRARMRDVLRVHSKSGKPFKARARDQIPPHLREWVEHTLDPLYMAIDGRRRAAA
jgi:hypothetical protein